MVPKDWMSTAILLITFLKGGRARLQMEAQRRSTELHRKKKVEKRCNHPRSTEDWKEMDIDGGRISTCYRRLFDA